MRLIILFLLFSQICLAQNTSVKIDLNMEGRTETEVNEPGYTPWYIARVHSATTTVSGITFTLTAKGPGNVIAFRSGWTKALVQSPNYSRLVNDGIRIDNDSMLAHPGKAAIVELVISGLTVGKHTIQTFHNIWEDTLNYTYCPINVYLNDTLIKSKVKRTNRVLSPSAATIILTELNVTQPGETMILRFEGTTDFTPVTGKTADYNIYLDAFELDTDDASRQAYDPYPTDGNMHANADTGAITLTWKPAINGYTQSHSIYFGTDSASVAGATQTNVQVYKGTLGYNTLSYKVEGMYNLNKYYWRVDQTDSSGLTTKGKVWSYRPRHLAFRGAEGYGRFAIGGRGGKVVYVTNLNDDGPGSFRQAVTNDIGPRTILFNVSGIIYLNSRLTVSSKYVTIAGQTSPGKGICFRAAPLGLGPDGICRFLRMRLGAGTTYDGIGMAGVDNGILDHASISWTIDEAFSSRNAKNITLQRTLISEALNVAGHVNYPAGTAHGYAGSIGGDVGSFHHNLLAHCEGRNWSLAGGLDGNAYYAGRLDIFNMVVYNWGGRATDGGAHEVNFVNNYYKKGAATSQNTVLKAQLEGTGKGTQSYYYAGNIKENTSGTLDCNGTDNTCSRTYVLSGGQVLDWEVFVDKPFFPSYATIETAKAAYKSVLSDVGNNLPLDDHDKRIINETLTGTYTYNGSYTGKHGLIDHQDDAGGYEDYPEITRPANFDTDLDGLPDWWETLHGTNMNSASGDFSEANADPDKDGYTALEDYLEWMAVPHYFLTEGVTDTIDLKGFITGFTKSPVLSSTPAGKFNVIINGYAAIITPNASSNGINYLDFKVTDTEGDTMVRRIGICVGISDNTSNQKLVVKDNSNQIRISPSLIDNQVNVYSSMDKNTHVQIVLSNLTGIEVVKKSTMLKSGQFSTEFSCPDIPSQIYVLKVVDSKSGKILFVQRVVKK